VTSLGSAPKPDPGPRGRLAQQVAAAVDAVDGVRRSGGSGVSGGFGGFGVSGGFGGSGVEVATQYPGGWVSGVRLGDDRIEIHIVAECPAVARVAADVHDAARQVLGAIGDHRAVAVVVDDLDVASLSARGS
jgi:hypothetical protein